MKITSRPVSLSSTILAAILAMTGSSKAAVKTWDGDSGAAWSIGNNWGTPTGTAPVSGDSVVFNASAVNFNPDLDIAGLSLTTLTLSGTGYTLSSSSNQILTLTATSSVSSTGTNAVNTINQGIAFGAVSTSVVLSNGSSLTFGTSGTMNFNGIGNTTTGLNTGANSTLTTNGPIIGNAITGAGTTTRLNKVGVGTWTINSSNNNLSSFDRVILNTGTIEIGATNALGTINIISTSGGTADVALLVTTAGATVANQVQFLNGGTATNVHTVGGSNTTGIATYDSGASALSLSNASAGTGNALLTQFTAAAGGRVEFRSVIQDQSTAAGRQGGINKVGNGTVAIYGANTYTLGTVVSAGTLLVNNSTGSGTGTGAVVVNAGATLGGTGMLSASVAVSGNLNAGDGGSTTGNLRVGGALDLSSAQNITFDLASTVRGTGYDGINVTGALTNGGALALRFGTAFLTGGETFDLFALSGGQSGDFSSVTLAGSYTGVLTNTSGVWSGRDAGNTYTFTYSELTGDLVISPAPEPSTYVLLAVGGGLLAFACSRRKTAVA